MTSLVSIVTLMVARFYLPDKLATMNDTAEVRIVAEFHAVPGKADALRALLTTLIAPTRTEPGCLQYDLHVSLADDHHLFFFERFTDVAAIEFHNERPHLKQLGDQLAELIAEPVKVTRVRQVG